jgi:hypothetical protein
MKDFNEYKEKIRKIFSSSFIEKENLEVGESWQKETMQKIRSLEPLNSNRQLFLIFEKMFWRFAFAASLILAVAFSFNLEIEAQREYEISQVFYEDPFDELLDEPLKVSR